MSVTLVSMSAYADLHDVSKQAVGKWKAKGYLVLREGKVWVEGSDRSLEHSGLGRFAAAAAGQPVDAPRQPQATTGQPPASTGAAPASGPTPPPASPSPLADLAAAVHQDDADPELALADFLDSFAAGAFVSIAVAEQVKQNALAAKRLVEARIAEEAVVDVELAEAVLFEQARLWRDAWMNFPTRVGPLIAADLGVEAGVAVELLTAHVHQQISDLGEVKADFAGDAEG